MDALKSYYEISPFFFIITASATLLYMTMNILMIFGGDTDHDASHSGHEHFAPDAAFKFFSTQTVLAFLMGFGWAGITTTVKWTLPMWQAVVVATAFGVVLMTFTAFLYAQVRKLNQTSSVNLYSALGSKANVYKQIPGSSEEGQIQVVVSGSLRIVSAVSVEEAIESFTEVEVVGVKDKNTLIVRKIVKDTSNGESA